ncbi:MAG: hypothetical protein ACI8ZB_003815 [Desulforhopalus sp.]|jgi:hypothetical protein
MRALSPDFYNDLENVNGLLRPVTEKLLNDHTLMLAIRDGYVNIYYRGGNLLKIQKSSSSYEVFFDANYNKESVKLPEIPKNVSTKDEVESLVKLFPYLKEVMDHYFAKNNKPEREFQQLVARENNYSSISNESEYFISDIEFADTEIGARFDILAVRWLASQRKNGSKCVPVLVEMKYGDNALDGSAGLIKHLEDIESMVSDSSGKYINLLKGMEEQFNQLDQLKLLNFNRSKSGTVVQLNPEDKPELVLLLANHNPRSEKLANIVNDEKLSQYADSDFFDLKFFVSSFAGYGMHSDCMLDLSQFRELLNR